MPGGDVFGAARDGVVEEGLELDFGVAQHVGVGGAAGLVFGEEIAEHAFLVFGGEVDRLDLDAEHVGHRQHVEKILARGALLGVVVVVPVLHEDAEHVVALLLQADRRRPRNRRRPTCRRRPWCSCVAHEVERKAPTGQVILHAAHHQRAAVRDGLAAISSGVSHTARTMPVSSARSASKPVTLQT
jgi:hypothetical protein